MKNASARFWENGNIFIHDRKLAFFITNHDGQYFLLALRVDSKDYVGCKLANDSLAPLASPYAVSVSALS